MQADKTIHIDENCIECGYSIFGNNGGEPHSLGRK